MDLICLNKILSLNSPSATIPPLFMVLDLSGINVSRFTSYTTPSPLHLGQAPYGELNENVFGDGSSYEIPDARHINFWNN